MKGTSYDGSYFANKGTSRSEGELMFSVGNLVAFGYSHYCSPDGRSSKSGLCPTANNYLLQEEIVLEEYDNTTRDSYGSGKYDVKKIVELPDVFWHTYSTNLLKKVFILQILDNDKNVFKNNFIPGDISEVRNHPEKFLHIYEIPSDYYGCERKSFQDTVDFINLKKKQEDEYTDKVLEKNFRGVELDFGITTRGGWYQPSASFGTSKIARAHEHDDSRTSLGKIVIMPCVPEGCYKMYIWGYPVSLYLRNGQCPDISILTSSSCCNSQSWWYNELDSTTIKKGWIFVNGKDIFESTIEIVEKNHHEKVVARNVKFEKLSKVVAEKYSEEVLKLVFRKKGLVLSILKVLSESEVQLPISEMKKIFHLSNSAPVIANLMACVASGVDTFKAAKVAKKAFAWAYVCDALPNIGFVGYFDDAIKALEIYSQNWRKEEKTSGNILGDFFRESGVIN